MNPDFRLAEDVQLSDLPTAMGPQDEPVVLASYTDEAAAAASPPEPPAPPRDVPDLPPDLCRPLLPLKDKCPPPAELRRAAELFHESAMFALDRCPELIDYNFVGWVCHGYNEEQDQYRVDARVGPGVRPNQLALLTVGIARAAPGHKPEVWTALTPLKMDYLRALPVPTFGSIARCLLAGAGGVENGATVPPGFGPPTFTPEEDPGWYRAALTGLRLLWDVVLHEDVDAFAPAVPNYHLPVEVETADGQKVKGLAPANCWVREPGTEVDPGEVTVRFPARALDRILYADYGWRLQPTPGFWEPTPDIGPWGVVHQWTTDQTGRPMRVEISPDLVVDYSGR